ncbi:MAG: hypothetical protein U1E62_00925 [Alsobacter sp.]
MSQAARLMLALGLVAGFGLAWTLWLDRWKARNGIARRADGSGSDGAGWSSGDGDGCGSDGGGDGGSCGD